jgi:hypothetical protein
MKVVSQSVRVTLRLTVSQYVLVSSPLRGCLTRYCFLFKSLGLEFVVLSLWGALSDERPCLSYVSHSLIIYLCVHLLFTFCLPHIYHIYTLYNTYNVLYIYIMYMYKIHIIYTRPLLVPARYSRSLVTDDFDI